MYLIKHGLIQRVSEFDTSDRMIDLVPVQSPLDPSYINARYSNYSDDN